MKYIVSFLILFLVSTTSAQVNISGKITNEKGELLDFVTVFFENTTYAASTDAKGQYTIRDVKSGDYMLKAIYLGYPSIIIPITIIKDTIVNLIFEGEIYSLDAIEIQANRIGEYGPFTRQNIGRSELNKYNTGQDATFLLQWTPSMVVTSDAGTGMGYSGLRLRGSDQTRINVTLNDVPVNDSESQNVFWVNMPDLMSSVNSVQIQRGVGQSTNGNGAFGGSVSLLTSDVKVNPFIDIASAYGSFNSRMFSAQMGTGLMENRYSVVGRISSIHSDGYVDRASADLNSYFFSASRVTGKSSLKLNVIHGKEKTYQAWNGVPQEKIDGDPEQLWQHYQMNKGGLYKTVQDSINLFESDRRYNYYTYDNQVDNYRQTHLQLIESWSPNADIKLKFTVFYTKGKGYFEEFKPKAKWSNYGIEPIIHADGTKTDRSDVVRRRWLNNDFLGMKADAAFHINTANELRVGVYGSSYSGLHYGNVIKSSVTIPDLDKERKYYDNTGTKYDVSAYASWTHRLSQRWILFGDIQFRWVDYTIKGIDKDLRMLDIADNNHFLNPKGGLSFIIDKHQKLYTSIAWAHKEPSRGDYIDNEFVEKPLPERLHDIEAGYTAQTDHFNLETNLYYMYYTNQLVLTGALNEVGANIRLNVPKSYRLGWETNASLKLHESILLSFNTTLSRNIIRSFTEIIPDYNDFEDEKIYHKNTHISFSPSFTGALFLAVMPVQGTEVIWSAKYVGSQYLDNTSSKNKILPAYYFHNLGFSKSFTSSYWRKLALTFEVKNVFDYRYSSNGYTYSYIDGDLITQNFVYPQAGRNWVLGLKAGF